MQRDRPVDILRGVAIVLMICNHIGAASWLTTLLNLPVWLDPAGPFVLLAGFVLGMAQRGTRPLTMVWSRARELWLIHVVCMACVLAVHEATGRLQAPSIASVGGLASAAWKVPLLRVQALDYMNILPMFIVFFAFAPVLGWALRRGQSWLCLSVSMSLWLYTQKSPGWLRFTDPACGPEAFVLPAWQFAFVLGLAGGFHGPALAAGVARVRAWLLPTASIVVGLLFALAQLQRNVAIGAGARLPAAQTWLVAKQTWAPLRAVYTVALLGLAHILLGYLIRTQRTRGLLWLELLGRRSLYCFLVHLPLALLASGLRFADIRGPVQDVAAASSIVLVYLLAKHQVLARYIPG